MTKAKRQRIGILIIVVALVVGTLGSFVVMILSTHDSQESARKYQEATAEYQKNQEAYQKKVDARDAELSKKYFVTFDSYSNQPAKFDIDSVKSLKKKDLKVGSGKTIDENTKFAAYYIGWNPDGKVFDQSIDDNKLKSPLMINGLKDTAVIDGWKEGLVGMKIGGVRLLEIPSDKAYGESGQGDDIGPNTPLKFVVMAIPAPEDIPEPEIPVELLQQLYGAGGQ